MLGFFVFFFLFLLDPKVQLSLPSLCLKVFPFFFFFALLFFLFFFFNFIFLLHCLF